MDLLARACQPDTNTSKLDTNEGQNNPNHRGTACGANNPNWASVHSMLYLAIEKAKLGNQAGNPRLAEPQGLHDP